MDDEIDDVNRAVFVALQGLMYDDPGAIERAAHLLSASRRLERIADLTTNIAEDVIYMVEVGLVRHHAMTRRCRQDGWGSGSHDPSLSVSGARTP